MAKEMFVSERLWRAIVDAFRTFLSDNPSAASLSNSPKTSIIQQVSFDSDRPERYHPPSPDASRTPPPNRQKNSSRRKSHVSKR